MGGHPVVRVQRSSGEARESLQVAVGERHAGPQPGSVLLERLSRLPGQAEVPGPELEDLVGGQHPRPRRRRPTDHPPAPPRLDDGDHGEGRADERARPWSDPAP